LILGNVIILGIILFSLNSFALGVSPAQKFVDFKPDAKETITFNIVNNEHKELRLLVKVRSDLDKYVKLDEKIVTLKPEEESKSYSLELDLPSKIDIPGTHKIEVVLLEIAPDVNPEENTLVTASSAMVYKIHVRVPYPSKYAESKLVINSGNVNDTVRFVMPIFNLGEENISKAKAIIKIKSKSGREITSLETNEISLKPKDEGKLDAEWIANVNPGIYTAEANIIYDDKQIKIEKDFEVGNLFIDIISIVVSDFTLGGIAQFEMLLENRWNQKISNVYAEMTVFDENKKGYPTFKTSTIDMEPYAMEKIRAYWDSKGAQVGIYDLKLIIYYAERTTEKLIKAYVDIDSIRTDYSPTARVVSAPKSGNREILIGSLVVVLILINIGWFVYFMKSRKKN